MADIIKLTHNGVEIVYDEKDNLFRFELRGRQRSATSLLKAKEAIDKQPTEKEKKAAFQRTRCWTKENMWSRGGSEWRIIEATSVADGYTGAYVWTVDGQKQRAKYRASDLVPCSPENDRKIEELRQAEKQIAELDERNSKAWEKLPRLEIRPES